MAIIENNTHAAIRSILYLTDFSEPSEGALPFVTAIARKCGAKVHAMHVLTPKPCLYTAAAPIGFLEEAEEERAKAEMQRTESQLSGLPHEATIEWGAGVWAATERALQQQEIDLIVLGTHGRTGAEKLLLGSVAEEIFRRSPVPVLTIGPQVSRSLHNGARFRRVLFPTDFSPESLAAARQAISLAQENQSQLVLLFVMRKPKERNEAGTERFEISVAEAIHRLYEIVPENVTLTYRPQVAIEYGEPAQRIVASAKEHNTDLIVLGVRNPTEHIGAATHLDHAIAHKVVANASCPVLTLRG
jgi:nucleotide-binding universal stress UspA family protein